MNIHEHALCTAQGKSAAAGNKSVGRKDYLVSFFYTQYQRGEFQRIGAGFGEEEIFELVMFSEPGLAF